MSVCVWRTSSPPPPHSITRVASMLSWEPATGAPSLSDWAACDAAHTPCLTPPSFRPLFHTRSGGLSEAVFRDAVSAVCASSSSAHPLPPPVYITVSGANALAGGAVSGSLAARPPNPWEQNWHRDTEAIPPQTRHLISPDMLLLSGGETVLATLVATHTGCWGSAAPNATATSAGFPFAVDVVMMEEEAGLLNFAQGGAGMPTVADVWNAVASVSDGNFRLYRPYPLVALTPDAFQALPPPAGPVPNVCVCTLPSPSRCLSSQLCPHSLSPAPLCVCAAQEPVRAHG